jgi:c-di-GMP-binding flagellar brake protein YcgR
MPQTQGFSHCVIEDMHLKGMRVSFNKPLPRPTHAEDPHRLPSLAEDSHRSQEPVRMSFAMGDNFDFIKIEATIPWTKEEQGRYVYGLSFSRISDEDKNRIYQYTNINCYDQFKNQWWGQGSL